MEVVYATYPRFISGGLKKKLKDHLDYTFTHLFVFILFTEAFTKVDMGHSRYKRAYDVFTADPPLN